MFGTNLSPILVTCIRLSPWEDFSDYHVRMINNLMTNPGASGENRAWIMIYSLMYLFEHMYHMFPIRILPKILCALPSDFHLIKKEGTPAIWIFHVSPCTSCKNADSTCRQRLGIDPSAASACVSLFHRSFASQDYLCTSEWRLLLSLIVCIGSTTPGQVLSNR